MAPPASLVHMHWSLPDLVSQPYLPLQGKVFLERCKDTLDRDGALVLPDFLTATAVDAIRLDGQAHRHLAFYTVSKHNIYLKPPDPSFASHHPRNREVASSKGCITTDQIPDTSALHALFGDAQFRAFVCAVLGEPELHAYADTMSSVNLHFAGAGQELGWHFDNSSFAITLLIQKPEAGGVFEYVKDVRDADRGELNYAVCGAVLDGSVPAKTLVMDPGTLVLFRGRNAMHRVTPTVGDHTRMLAVLAYNTQPGIALSESARMTFYGRLGRVIEAPAAFAANPQALVKQACASRSADHP